MSKDYYSILGVEKGANKDEIKKAFRKKAHELHPDKQGGDEAKFKEINEAYQVLGDETKRQQYDQYGSTFDGAGGFPGGGFGGGQGMHFEDLSDLFGGMFGGGGFGGGGARQAQGNDIQVDVKLSFKESVFGADKELTVSKNNKCERCAGNGGEPGKGLKKCGDCGGNGVKVIMQRTMFGNVQTRVTCGTCSGNGEIPEVKCTACSGSGLAYGKRTLRVSIPPGVEHGMKMRVRNEGESIGARGANGDLYVRIFVENDPRFERADDDIYSVQKIGFTQAALGDEVETDTVDGKVKLKIPAGIQSGEKLRLRGKGVQTPRGRGDHYVVIEIITPKKLSRAEKRLLEELDLRV